MASNLLVQENEDSLVFQAAERPRTLYALVSVGVVCGFVVLVARWHALSLTLTLIAGAAAVGLALIGALRTRRSELHVTNLEYVSRGTTFTGLFHASQSIPRADVQCLEYQEDMSGPEWDHPGGVYAKLKRRSVCILPHVDAAQAAAVIQRIGTKFVDLGDNGKCESGFGNHFTSLGL